MNSINIIYNFLKKYTGIIESDKNQNQCLIYPKSSGFLIHIL